MLKIEICISTIEDELPEHYGYYNSVEDAIQDLKELGRQYSEEEE